MLNDKIKFLKDYFTGKRKKMPAYMYMPVKVMMWYAATPDLYFDKDDKSKSYTADEIAELKNEYFLVIPYISKSKEELAISEEARKKLAEIEAKNAADAHE